jgi:hypothetical protein
LSQKINENPDINKYFDHIHNNNGENFTYVTYGSAQPATHSIYEIKGFFQILIDNREAQGQIRSAFKLNKITSLSLPLWSQPLQEEVLNAFSDALLSNSSFSNSFKTFLESTPLVGDLALAIRRIKTKEQCENFIKDFSKLCIARDYAKISDKFFEMQRSTFSGKEPAAFTLSQGQTHSQPQPKSEIGELPAGIEKLSKHTAAELIDQVDRVTEENINKFLVRLAAQQERLKVNPESLVRKNTAATEEEKKYINLTFEDVLTDKLRNPPSNEEMMQQLALRKEIVSTLEKDLFVQLTETLNNSFNELAQMYINLSKEGIVSNRKNTLTVIDGKNSP